MDVTNFDGTISDWTDAYPVYAGAAEDPEDIESWRKTDISAITFFKYDADYLYILANVYDNIFYGRWTGTAMWHSDSIQMLIDPLNNGGTTPQSDDYGFFMGYTKNGYEFISNEGPNGASNSNIFQYDNALMAIRDDDLHVTRYLMKLPWSAVAPLQPNYGSKFRLNMVFNDADIEERHNYAEFTYGLYIGNKDRTPGNFYEFIFGGAEQNTTPITEDTILDITMESDMVQL